MMTGDRTVGMQQETCWASWSSRRSKLVSTPEEAGEDLNNTVTASANEKERTPVLTQVKGEKDHNG